VARELELIETALRSWVRQAEIDAGRGTPGALTTAEREELGATPSREPDAADGARHSKKRACRAPCDGLLCDGERMRFAFIATEKAAFPIPAAVPHAAGLARGLLRVASAAAGPARADGRTVERRDRGDPRGESGALCQSLDSRRVAGRRRPHGA
jgi:hypothetical protein